MPAGQLLAFNVKTEDLEKTLKSVGDVAAGTGVSIIEMSAIYGKALSKNKLQAEELNQLQERGVPILKTLGEMYDKTANEIYEMGFGWQINWQGLNRCF